jgi:hypothetical protein
MILSFLGFIGDLGEPFFKNERTYHTYYLSISPDNRCVELLEVLGDTSKVRYRFKLGQTISSMLFKWKVSAILGLTPDEDVVFKLMDINMADDYTIELPSYEVRAHVVVGDVTLKRG